MPLKREDTAKRFWSRYVSDRVAYMPVKRFRDWVDSLPRDEFFAMIDANNTPHRPRKSAVSKKTQPPRSIPNQLSSDDLCKQLAAIAAFNRHNNPKAADAVYRAIRTLQALDAAAISAGILAGGADHP